MIANRVQEQASARSDRATLKLLDGLARQRNGDARRGTVRTLLREPTLFVLLAGLYFERTGDVETLNELWPAIEASLSWIDGPADRDRDGS
jgi:hypothetical protein